MTQPRETEWEWAAAWGESTDKTDRAVTAARRRGGRRRPPIDRWIIGFVIAAAIGLVAYATLPAGGSPNRSSPDLSDAPLWTDTVTPDAPAPTSQALSTSAAAPPGVTTVATTKTTTKPAPTTPTRTSTAPPPFTPIAIEAEASGNLLVGGAEPVACAPCPGGYRVRYIGGAAAVTIPTSLAVSGVRTLTVTYETDGPRLLKLSANGTVIDTRLLTGPGWESPQTYQVTATLPAGALNLMFFDDEGPAPDLDKVVIR